MAYNSKAVVFVSAPATPGLAADHTHSSEVDEEVATNPSGQVTSDSDRARPTHKHKHLADVHHLYLSVL